MKPLNILVSKESEPYVLDFGLANSLQTDEAHYEITAKGLAELRERKLRWRQFREAMDRVIGELAKTLADAGFIEDGATVAELALRREAIISTAVDHGLAFPHVRDVEDGGLKFAVGLKEKGLDFGEHEGRLSKIFFFIVIPTPATAFYLRLLAGLVLTFESTEARQALYDCEKPEQMWKVLTKLTKDAIP